MFSTTLRALILSLLIGSSITQAHAQIRTDASLGGVAQTLTGPKFLIPQTLGKLSGNNLFHSFQTFNIGTGEIATFTTTTSTIANIFSRVTGGSASTINGALKLQAVAGAPNFFFINPAGVTFGAGASIDVPGAFHVTTADYIKFPDGNFHADTTKASTFSSELPEAFGFLGSARGTISVRNGAVLATTGQSISIIAGDVEIDGGSVSTMDGGNIRAVALGQRSQEIGLTTDLPVSYGNLSILNGGVIVSGTVSADSGNGGEIQLTAGDITIDGGCCTSGIYSGSLSGGNAGDIEIATTGKLSVINSAYIASSASSSGSGGAIYINAGSVVLDGQGYFSSIFSETVNGGAGSAGNVAVNAIGDLSLIDGGQIYSSTYSKGAAGSVKVSADSMLIDRQGGKLTSIFSNAESGSTGHAGSIDVSVTGNLSILNQGQIASLTKSSGNAGAIRVNAGTMSIVGQDWNADNEFTGILSDADLYSSGGHAGSVDVSVTGSLSLTNGVIQSNTYASGNAGSVKVAAGSISIDGKGDFTSGISTSTYGTIGNAGSVEVTTTGNLSIVNGGRIDS